MLHWKIIGAGSIILFGSLMIFLWQFSSCMEVKSFVHCTFFWKFYW